MSRYDEILADYKARYDLDDIDSPNDRSNLNSLIRNQILIETMHNRLDTVLEEEDILDKIGDIKKLQDGLRDLQEKNIELERVLAIDRKSRKKDNQSSLSDYIIELKKMSSEFLRDRVTYMFCPDCMVMVGRFLAVHDHTHFRVEVKCSQCDKFVYAERNQKDVFFDLKEKSEWRKKHPVIVEQPIKYAQEDYEDDVSIVIEEE